MAPQTRQDTEVLIATWRLRVQVYWKPLTRHASPLRILPSMELHRDHSAIIEEIWNLAGGESLIAASEKLLDYLLSEEGLSRYDVAERWSRFDQALETEDTFLRDIVNGKCDLATHELQKRVVDTFTENIVNSVDPQHLIPHLVSKGLIGDREQETLLCKTQQMGRSMGALYMVSQLHRSGNKDWYRDFVDVLRDTDHAELVRQLEPHIKLNEAVPQEGIHKLNISEDPGLTGQQHLPDPSHTGKQHLPDPSLTRQQLLSGPSLTGQQHQPGPGLTGQHLPDTHLTEHLLGPGPTRQQVGHACKSRSIPSVLLPEDVVGVDVDDKGDTFPYPPSPGASSTASQRSNDLSWSTITSLEGSSLERPNQLMQACQTCRKTFKDLSVHVCQGDTTCNDDSFMFDGPMSSYDSFISGPMGSYCSSTIGEDLSFCDSLTSTGSSDFSGLLTSGPTNSPESSDLGSHQCPTCGKDFKQLSRHKCKQATANDTSFESTSTASTTSSASTATNVSGNRNDKIERDLKACPTCGKTFKQLSRHVCKGSITPNQGRDRGMENCPTCGKAFKQLSRHVCKGAKTFDQSFDSTSTASGISSASQGSNHGMENCPTCGKAFTQLSRHVCKGAKSFDQSFESTSTASGISSASQGSNHGMENCPTCGKAFKQLSRHVCKGTKSFDQSFESTSTAAGISSASTTTPSGNRNDGMERYLQACPTCERTFKQLSRHVCKGAATPNQGSNHGMENCPTCGKAFKQLSRHICKGAKSFDQSFDSTSTASGISSTSQGSNHGMKNCPTCGKAFKQLSRHVCKAATPNQGSNHGMDNCPTCGKAFKQLSRHVCKEAKSFDQSFDSTSTASGISSASQGSNHGMENCPTCGKAFKQLSRHVCKGAKSFDQSFDSTSTASGISSASHGSNHGMTNCPTCDKAFKQLSRHVCKGAKSFDQSFESTSTASGISSASTTTSSGNRNDGMERYLQACPTCGKTFKQLSRHVCKHAKK